MRLRVQVIEPSGILDGVKAKQLQSQIKDIVADGVDIVLIDLENVRYMDSSGLGALIAVQRLIRKANGNFFLCSVNDQVNMLLELTKMNQLFKIFANRDEFNTEVISKA
jgi:anti-anti-sigma factor